MMVFSNEDYTRRKSVRGRGYARRAQSANAASRQGSNATYSTTPSQQSIQKNNNPVGQKGNNNNLSEKLRQMTRLREEMETLAASHREEEDRIRQLLRRDGTTPLENVVLERDNALKLLDTFQREGNKIIENLHTSVSSLQQEKKNLRAELHECHQENNRLRDVVRRMSAPPTPKRQVQDAKVQGADMITREHHESAIQEYQELLTEADNMLISLRDENMNLKDELEGMRSKMTDESQTNDDKKIENILVRELRLEKKQRLDAEEHAHDLMIQHQRHVQLLEQRLGQLTRLLYSSNGTPRRQGNEPLPSPKPSANSDLSSVTTFTVNCAPGDDVCGVETPRAFSEHMSPFQQRRANRDLTLSRGACQVNIDTPSQVSDEQSFPPKESLNSEIESKIDEQLQNDRTIKDVNNDIPHNNEYGPHSSECTHVGKPNDDHTAETRLSPDVADAGATDGIPNNERGPSSGEDIVVRRQPRDVDFDTNARLPPEDAIGAEIRDNTYSPPESKLDTIRSPEKSPNAHADRETEALHLEAQEISRDLLLL